MLKIDDTCRLQAWAGAGASGVESSLVCRAGGSLAAREIGFCRFSPATARLVRISGTISNVSNCCGAVVIIECRPTSMCALAGKSPEQWARAGEGWGWGVNIVGG